VDEDNPNLDVAPSSELLPVDGLLLRYSFPSNEELHPARLEAEAELGGVEVEEAELSEHFGVWRETTPPRLALRFPFKTSLNFIGLEVVVVAVDVLLCSASLAKVVALVDDKMHLCRVPTSKILPVELSTCRAVPLVYNPFDGLSVCKQINTKI